MAIYNERASATEEIIDSVRDLYSLKLKLPLGNPNLKLVHTNQFIFTELPTDVFELVNMEIISKALNSKYSRFSGYKINRWYVEGVTITNDKSHFDMELDLNPFASNFNKYRSEMRDIEKAYTDAFNKNNTTTSTSSTKTVKKVKSTTNNLKLYNVKGFKKSDQQYIKKVVNQALKKANNPKDHFKQCTALHDYYKSNHVYNKYNDTPKMDAYGFEGCWKKKGHNCGDGALTLKAMFKCLGFNDVQVVLGHHHYWIKIKVDGTYCYCDQSGGEGKHNWRTFGKKYNNNTVWQG